MPITGLYSTEDTSALQKNRTVPTAPLKDSAKKTTCNIKPREFFLNFRGKKQKFAAKKTARDFNFRKCPTIGHTSLEPFFITIVFNLEISYTNRMRMPWQTGQQFHKVLQP